MTKGERQMGDYREKYAVLMNKYTRVLDKNTTLNKRLSAANRQLDSIAIDFNNTIQQLRSKIEEQNAIIKALKAQIARLEALGNHDGTNTGLPTSQTPINKRKVIPNSRQKSEKLRGGQIGHKALFLKIPEEVTEIVEHEIDNEECQNCHSNNIESIGQYEDRYEYEVKVTTHHILHRSYLFILSKLKRGFDTMLLR